MITPLRNFLPSQSPSWLRQLLRAPGIAHSREFNIRQWFDGDAIVNANYLDEYRHSVNQKKSAGTAECSFRVSSDGDG